MRPCRRCARRVARMCMYGSAMRAGRAMNVKIRQPGEPVAGLPAANKMLRERAIQSPVRLTTTTQRRKSNENAFGGN